MSVLLRVSIVVLLAWGTAVAGNPGDDDEPSDLPVAPAATSAIADAGPVERILPERAAKIDGHAAEATAPFAPFDAEGSESDVGSESLARLVLTRSANREESESLSQEKARDRKSPEDTGIPGAIVAVIFGVFGLLVVARRNPR